MIQGLFNGAAAMDVLAQQQAIISDNLANLNTPGHRRFNYAAQELSDSSQAQGPLRQDQFVSTIPELARTKVDFTQGRHEQTGRSLDTAIDGDAFLALENTDGNPLYTRNGRLFRNAESGLLVNDEGFPLRGTDGPISVPNDVGENEIFIDGDGTVSGRGQVLGQLQLTSFTDNDSLVPISQTIFQAGPESETTESQASLKQFHLEKSNAHPVTELIALITGSRQYEAIQKASSAISESLREHIRT